MTRRQETSAHAQGTLNGIPIDHHTHLAPDRTRRLQRQPQTESVPDRSRNQPVAATLGLRPRSAPVVRTLRRVFRGYS